MCPPAPAIVADGLTKRYGDAVAIADLDLTVDPGNVFGFLGPNGAGKTSTIRILTTLTEPTAGTARVAGHPVSDRASVVEHIGVLPETPALYDELTGREQLEYVAGLRGHDDWDRVESLLERFDLADDANRRVATYSKGMKQKLGLVQALLHEPSVLFLDEPTSGLDPRAARTVCDTISEVAAAETTVFLSTHILPVVEELADTVGVLYDGDLVAEGAPSELTDDVEAGSTLEDVFLDVTSEQATQR
ncbi:MULTISPECIES: ABC transporter ATP-binding protein [Haloarcula]|uniref:Multidrug ABC transporter ATP-binding protein n=1 Tax=Haloarcula pellucida TaxID=1427151 RepID=A0A830GT92_9EURY|nr:MULTISPECIES: ABC transporter ATP-binding protein [Halomicroarcula]MBX0350189.1 ABC transporter ATP-binding protein [Halomicroarcula pellucida]MDS0277709.1 ABC transporter ATP-binding protein [Halomicroarcula sp. S1AR25-4]GGO00810.1 multidrug ABC transporter ATP-binding protein [Halomicroarcula pellucida]